MIPSDGSGWISGSLAGRVYRDTVSKLDTDGGSLNRYHHHGADSHGLYWGKDWRKGLMECPRHRTQSAPTI